MAMGSHQSAKGFTDEWLTPVRILQHLGDFDLDPCSPAIRPWPTAACHISLPQNGLTAEWSGRIWLNPPYGNKIERWLARMAIHGNGIALVFARTETVWFQNHVFRGATGILFLAGRINFYHGDGSESKYNAGAPTVLAAFDRSSPWNNAATLRSAARALNGVFMPVDHSQFRA